MLERCYMMLLLVLLLAGFKHASSEMGPLSCLVNDVQRCKNVEVGHMEGC